MPKCYQCKQYVDKEHAIIIDITKENAKRKSYRYLHEKCSSEYKKEQELIKKRKEEYKKWDELYQYIKNEIFKYDKNQSLSKHFVGRLQGLRSGEYSFKRNKEVFLSKDGYSYDVILLTFKLKKYDILRAIETVNFENERHKEDYIIAIILNNINDVYLRLKERQKSNERLQKYEFDNVYTKKVEFKNKSNVKENKVANKLKNLF